MARTFLTAPMMKCLPLALALLIIQGDGAGSVGYVLCMAGCMNWCVVAAATGPGAPAAYSACVAGCAIACVCFPTDMQVTGRDGQVNVAGVNVGDEVLTQDAEGRDVFTKVTQVEFIPGNFSFVSMTLDDRDHSVVTATDWHGMLVKTASGPTVVKEAAHVAEKDVLLVRGYGSASVVGTRRFTQAGKYSISTEACTMYANNVLTTTTCMDADKSEAFVQTMERPPSLDAAFFKAASAGTLV